MKEVADFANDSTDRLREIANKGGVQNPENFANVINGCPLVMFHIILYSRTNREADE